MPRCGGIGGIVVGSASAHLVESRGSGGRIGCDSVGADPFARKGFLASRHISDDTHKIKYVSAAAVVRVFSSGAATAAAVAEDGGCGHRFRGGQRHLRGNTSFPLSLFAYSFLIPRPTPPGCQRVRQHRRLRISHARQRFGGAIVSWVLGADAGVERNDCAVKRL